MRVDSDDAVLDLSSDAEVTVQDYDDVDTEYGLDELSPQFVEMLIDKILVFMEVLVGHGLHPYQQPLGRRIIESVLVNDGDVITSQASRQSGKTETVADVVAALMVLMPRLAKIYPDLLGRFKDGIWVGMFAPVESQAETLFGRVVSRLTSERATEILGDSEIDDVTKRSPGVTRGIMLKKSGSTLLMMTANPRAKIESKTFHLVVLDEAQEMDDFIIQKSISPMMAYTAGTMVMTGTPARTKNHFYKTIQLNKRLAAGRKKRRNHFEWNWRDVAKVNKNYERFIKKEMLRIGEDSDEFQLCVAPETRVLTADLRHIRADEVRVGMELVGFDEEVPGYNEHRKFRTAVVEAVSMPVLPCYRITLSDGTQVTASEDHLWLVRTSGARTVWMKTKDLATKRYASKGGLPRIIRATDVWQEEPFTYERGYINGAFEGEGHLSSTHPGALSVCFSQKPNPMLDTVRKYVEDAGFRTFEYEQPHGCHILSIGGGSSRVVEFLGRFRPQRLVDKFRPEMLGSLTRRGEEIEHPQVVSVEPLGEMETVAFRTSTRTFVAEGLASHNSYEVRWLLDRGMFITQTVFENLGDKTMQTVKAWHNTPIVVGVDPARKTDSTVVTAVWVDWDRPDEFGYFDHRILNWLEIQGDDWEQQYFQIVHFLASYNVLAVGVDANGVGDAVAQRLAVLLPMAEVVPVSSSQAEQSARFKHLQALIQREMISWPAHAKTRRLRTYNRFMQQMLDAEKKFAGQYFTVEAPQEVGAHDDYVDSLAIATSLTKDLTMPSVEVSNSPFFG